MPDSDSSKSRLEKALANPLFIVLMFVILILPTAWRPGVRTDMNAMERLSILSSQETWLRWHDGEENALLIPYLNENPRLQKPPLVLWMNILAWSDLDPATTTAEEMIGRARMVSAAMTFILLLSVFWIGCSLQDRQLGIIAAMTAATMWFLQRQGRMDSYDIHVAGWAGLSVAGGLWAIKPLAVSPQTIIKQILGWLIAALALAASWMSKNPLALLFVCTGFGAVCILQKERRLKNILWLCACVLIAYLLTLPWYMFVDAAIPNAAEIRALEYSTIRKEYQWPHYYFAIFGLVWPWSIWLIAGLCQPFMRATGKERLRRLIPWFWFMLIFIAMSTHPAKQQRYILPIIPAAALLIAQVWRDYQALSEKGQTDKGVKPLRVIHWLMLCIVSIVFLPVFLKANEISEYLSEDGVASLHSEGWPIAIGVGVVLFVLAIIGWRKHAENKPLAAVTIGSLWAVIFTIVLWNAQVTAPAATHPVRPEASRVASIIGDAPLYVINPTEREVFVHSAFRLYMVRRIIKLQPEEIEQLAAESTKPFYVMSPQTHMEERMLEKAGLTRVIDFFDEPANHRWLWAWE